MIKLNMFFIVYNVLECKIEVKIYEVVGSMNVNFGEMEFDIYDSGGVGGLLYNNCMLFVEYMKVGGIVYLDYGVIVEEKEDDEENEFFEEVDDIEFYDNVKVILVNGLMIKVKNIIVKFGLLVNGEGNEIFLLKVIEKV